MRKEIRLGSCEYVPCDTGDPPNELSESEILRLPQSCGGVLGVSWLSSNDHHSYSVATWEIFGDDHAHRHRILGSLEIRLVLHMRRGDEVTAFLRRADTSQSLRAAPSKVS